MKGYKGMPGDMARNGVQYEIGKTYSTKEPISLSHYGFHFSQTLHDVFNYYKNLDGNRFFEIEADGEIIVGDDQCVCSKITIVRELTPEEIDNAYSKD